jgi:hypothetical protein
MFNRFKRQWKALRQSQPGHRFQDRYENSRRSKDQGGVAGRVLKIGAALVSFVIGVVLVFIPGPAILFFAIAGGMMATESRWVARGLDGLELRIRAVIRWGVRHWQKLHAGGKTAVVSVAAVGGGAMAYASYRLLAG